MSEPRKFKDGASEDTIIIGNYDASLQLTTGRTIRMTGYVYAGDTDAEVIRRLNMVQDILDAQSIRCDIQNKEAQITAIHAGLIELKSNYDRLAARKQESLGDPKRKLTSVEKQSLDHYDQQVTGANAQIRSLQAAIELGRKRLNGYFQPQA